MPVRAIASEPAEEIPAWQFWSPATHGRSRYVPLSPTVVAPLAALTVSALFVVLDVLYTVGTS